MLETLGLDLIPLVLSHLDRKSLHSVVLSSRYLLEPGLNELWRFIATFEPLIACLPDDLLDFEMNAMDRRVYSLKRPLDISDLNRYLEGYAFRIRHINYDDFRGGDHGTLSHKALLALQITTAHLPHGSLSPNLKRFSWDNARNCETEAGTVAMSLFMPPTLDTWTFGMVEGDWVHQTGLHHAAHHLLGIRSLKIFCSPDPFVDKFIVSSLRTQNLQNLRLAHAPTPLLRHLCTLPKVERMDLLDQTPVSFRYPPGDTPQLPSTDNFRSLKSLRMDSREICALGPVIQYLPSTNCVRLLKAVAYVAARCVEEQALVTVVGVHGNQAAMRMLLLSNSNAQHTEDVDLEQTLDISPLFRLDLEACHISLSNRISIKPQTISQMASAWGHMHLLRLESPAYLDFIRPPVINHRDILQLLVGMPSLRHLSLQFDASQICSDEPVNPKESFPHGLKSWIVGRSPISSPSCVAQFLNAIVPHLKGLRTESFGGYNGSWGKVNELLGLWHP
ncbi:hypothetical protein DFP72DRAFT_426631 [Ephemerocybe angulata]|uniref:F-box domain-containing protein n=1 Tax=Ephemerocybe angulata TaxID=980116 RepID=A0A8H6M5T2_9AGAR|nr:hypothetical protein DFP72DRAFT_426631 [Tulosesus angulatus]